MKPLCNSLILLSVGGLNLGIGRWIIEPLNPRNFHSVAANIYGIWMLVSLLFLLLGAIGMIRVLASLMQKRRVRGETAH